MKDFLGYGRSRSSSGKGDVVKRHFNEYVNCLHAQVGTARENMEVLVAEFLEPIGCAMRGRNTENPSERGKSNGKYKQRIEMGRNISNTITSVQKDSLVAEPIIIDDYNQRVPQDQDVIGTVTTQFGNLAPRHGYKIAEPICLNSKVNGKQPSLENRIYDVSGTSTCITTCFHPNKQTPSYRIRKLTPRECFRLMGVTETNIDKIQQSGVSNSQQYKMAGNSIVVDVMYYIFKNMFAEEKGYTTNNSGQLSLF